MTVSALLYGFAAAHLALSIHAAVATVNSVDFLAHMPATYPTTIRADLDISSVMSLQSAVQCPTSILLALNVSTLPLPFC